MKTTADKTDRIKAVSVIYQENGKFLLVRRARAPYKGWLSFPGGKVEEFETAKAAAKRELFEETGLISNSFKHIQTIDMLSYKSNYLLYVFQAFNTKGQACASDDAVEIYWLSFHKMSHYKVIPTVIDMARHIFEKENQK